MKQERLFDSEVVRKVVSAAQSRIEYVSQIELDIEDDAAVIEDETAYFVQAWVRMPKTKKGSAKPQS
jgi:hypothetical protein